MNGLDTNILVRYIVKDDSQQTEFATRFIETQCTEAAPGFVSQLVLAELFWVLARGYRYSKPLLIQVLSKLLSAVELVIEDASDAWLALRAYERDTADFADYLIGLRGRAAGCETVFTFDRKASKSEWHTLVD